MNCSSTKQMGSIRRQRRGAAVMELAVSLPVILLIGLGTIQASSMLFLRQAMVQSAYEAAKVAVDANKTNTEATEAARRVAAGRRINSLQVDFSPANVATARQGQLIRVTVTAPSNSNSLIPFGVFQNRSVSATAVMAKE